MMSSYRRLLIADVNVGRFWPSIQREVPFRSATCLDALDTALQQVTDEFDYVIVATVTSLLIEEGSAIDAKGSSINALDPFIKLVVAAGRKSPGCEV